MAISTKDKFNDNNLLITGSSLATGGLYDRVHIVGEATIDGDLECARLKCVGTLEMEGSLKSGAVNVVGTSSISGNLHADSMKISGTVAIGGAVRLKELQCSGTIEGNGDLYSEQLVLKGEMKTNGDCEAEVFNARGMFHIGGLLNAGTLDIKLHGNCEAKEIGGERIRVTRASLFNPFSFFFKPSTHALLTAAVIEGDDVHLMNTKAKVVRGNNVIIGSGCEIALVEYKGHFEQQKGAVVHENRKI
ncbi:protein CcmA, bactofilin family [Paenibacillus sp. 1_12]|uniref:polymer-forming cytoskeletal protein n=1 Tax=Paenibacillus sp. 1_12 TaxID=1566278 RepID=UPI0008E2096D|nr:polymer-forming cytoskeletal protein [Paenibacillus sp. 1_12]SFM23056.1 protein CcmA, bactofilin family [Paenibacillus sp. 1_12]